MKKFTTLFNGILFMCICGVLLSYYAYVVETSKEEDENYEAMCDISEHMSCTKAFTSRYGKGFGFVGPVLGEHSIFNQPNSVYGISFYCLIGALTFLDSSLASRIQFWISLFSNIGSAYLAYILAFILHDFCVVCVSTYFVNLVITVLTYLRFKNLKNHRTPHHKMN
ncbi:vitamin K epoxide reductase complex subunit 1-like protein 1 [Hetaerina americana]|uniref:vitamin K epoxide reductase complex subunit 1-like protein 1 n=1 Tax=Hetaerina americana TaxID=62018 RepID=UPI003A7F3118